MNNIDYLKKYLPADKLEDGIKRLESGEPVQYIVGNVDFYGYIFDVNKNTLIPRFETEGLVEKTINYIHKYFDPKVDILDLGTGSGCIGITLNLRVDSNVTCVDISSKALEVARGNALKYNCDIKFIESDMFSKVTGKYDVIISNPPYIAYDEKIMDIVKNNEPSNALYASNDGLYYYEDIISKASSYLKDRYIIAFEIGYTQGDRIKDLANKFFPDSIVTVEKDLYGKDRYVFIIKKDE